jgi:hypothetical protein
MKSDSQHEEGVQPTEVEQSQQEKTPEQIRQEAEDRATARLGWTGVGGKAMGRP